MHDDVSSPGRSEELVSLITWHQRRLFAYIMALVRSPNDAEDILQEVNVVLWRKREDFQAGTDFLAWAFRISRTQVMAFRARRQRREDPFDEALLEMIAAAAEAESAQYDRRDSALRACLEKLPQRQREIVIRRYQPNELVEVMAAEMGKTSKALSESLRRIRDTLRRCIERTLSAEPS